MDKLCVITCECVGYNIFEEEILKSDQWVALKLLQWLFLKKELLEPHLKITYNISPGTIFYVDSESEVRISIFDLCHVLWPDLRWLITNKTNDTAILAQQIQIFPHPDFTRCGIQLCGSCNLFWDTQSSIQCFII